MTDFTNILDPDYPTVDLTQVTPDPAMVALMVPTRTVDSSGEEQGQFTTGTRPTLDQVTRLIPQAVQTVLSDIPDHVPEAAYPRIKQAATFQSAILIELTFFREQWAKGSATGLEANYQKLLTAIERVADGFSAPGNRVDSIMGRSTMAEYEPDYPLPPPRVMPRVPSIDDVTADEAQADN